jgi:hypothetical protein
LIDLPKYSRTQDKRPGGEEESWGKKEDKSNTEGKQQEGRVDNIRRQSPFFSDKKQTGLNNSSRTIVIDKKETFISLVLIF